MLHVLLAGLWGIADEAQVTERRWEIAGRDYMAYIGNFGLRGAAEQLEQPLFEALFRQATAALRAEKLDQDTHWSRLFFCNLNGEFVTEALLDNQRWEAGLSMLGALPYGGAGLLQSAPFHAAARGVRTCLRSRELGRDKAKTSEKRNVQVVHKHFELGFNAHFYPSRRRAADRKPAPQPR